jgi:carboxyl-terminal processing protease
MKIHHRLAASLLLGLLASGMVRAQDCSLLGQNAFVRDVMDEYYLWYRELPSLDPALFDSPEAYLEALRYRPLDRGFSYIVPKEISSAFFSASQSIGIGFTWRPTSETEIRMTQVYPDSPASEAGLRRGQYLTAVNGRPVEELLRAGDLLAELGPAQIGYTVSLSFRANRTNGEERTETVTKRPYTIPTVSQTEVFDVKGLPVGYLHFRNFVEPSYAALDDAFAEFRRERVTDLILDLRYNGGGLVDVATHLASLIGGMRTNTHVFVELRFNDKHSDLNQTRRFDDPPQTLDLPRVVVITTRASASASELVINGLKPFIPVTIVGARSYGKPVGQSGFEFCEKILYPVTVKLVNELGEGDYFDGFPPDCTAKDDLNRPLGHPEEDSLEEALHFLRTGRCSVPSSVREKDQRLVLPEVALDGWSQLVNAW